ncbi:MAG: histidinol dehydrogenase, partial [Collinsella sp.]|nr:histidinol dehydrogenase [Collinsella sp.]
TPEGLLSDAPATQRLAEAEGLWAHALSAALRRRVLEQGEDAVSAASLAAADLTKVAWPGDATATVSEGVDLTAAAGADGAPTGKEA